MYSQTTIVGFLGSSPEMRYTGTGTPVTSFSVAVSEKWTAQDGTQQEKTTWFRVAAWNKLAETCANYLDKGRQVMVIGKMQQPNVWTDKEGNSRANLELKAFQVKFLGKAGDAPTQQPAQQQPAQQQQRGTQSAANDDLGFDEDIPF